MLRIGYVRLRDIEAEAETQGLMAAGCHVVRAEEPGAAAPVLNSILDFIAQGDRLIVGRIEHLGDSARDLIEVVERLEARGGGLQVLDPDISTEGPGGAAVRATLEAVARLDPAPVRRGRPKAADHEMRALHRAGVGPVEIARRLGVSRMTVWRKLKTLEA